MFFGFFLILACPLQSFSEGRQGEARQLRFEAELSDLEMRCGQQVSKETLELSIELEEAVGRNGFRLQLPGCGLAVWRFGGWWTDLFSS